jgi:Family of unknown function (DUF5336)
MMSAYGSPSRGSASDTKREQMMSYVAGALGVLMFIWGFLKWLEIGNGNDKQKYAGYAFGTPTSAVIGFSLAAGLMAVLGATDRRSGRGVPSAIPTALAATSLLLAVGILIGKDSISPDGGSDVGVKVGLILGLITAIVQTAVLAAGLASRHGDAANTTGAPLGQQGGYGTQTHSGYDPSPQGGYAPPAQGGYAPPAQDAYAPPAQGGHTAPAPGGYSTPAQGGATPPTGGQGY